MLRKKASLSLLLISLSVINHVHAESKPPAPIGINYDRINEAKPILPFVLQVAKRYGEFKEKLQDKYHIQFSMNASLMPQVGIPRGGKAATQIYLTPSINWEFLNHPTYGRNSIQFFYENVNYTAAGINGDYVADKIKVASSINDNDQRANVFSQLTYRYDLPNDYVAVSLGQYSFYNFDRNQYTQNAQINFINYALSQNGSSTYANAGVGGFVQINPTHQLAIITGIQSAENIRGANIQWNQFFHGAHAWFAELAWSPHIKDMGSSYLGLLFYKQPSVTQQPITSNGVSFSAVQNINEHWGVFMRANTASQSLFNIKASYLAGVVNNNPLRRDTRDQIGVGLAMNRVNQKAFPMQQTRSYEELTEIYWAWTFFHWFQITPDVQIYLNPGLDKKQSFSAVYTLRSNIIF